MSTVSIVTQLNLKYPLTYKIIITSTLAVYEIYETDQEEIIVNLMKAEIIWLCLNKIKVFSRADSFKWKFCLPFTTN